MAGAGGTRGGRAGSGPGVRGGDLHAPFGRGRTRPRRRDHGTAQRADGRGADRPQGRFETRHDPRRQHPGTAVRGSARGPRLHSARCRARGPGPLRTEPVRGPDPQGLRPDSRHDPAHTRGQRQGRARRARRVVRFDLPHRDPHAPCAHSPGLRRRRSSRGDRGSRLHRGPGLPRSGPDCHGPVRDRPGTGQDRDAGRYPRGYPHGG